MKSTTIQNSTHTQIRLNQADLQAEIHAHSNKPILIEHAGISAVSSQMDSTHDPINWFLKCMGKNYFNFSGHAARAELWSFIFIGTLISFFTIATDDIFGIGTASYIVNGLLVIPLLAVGARRLHDIGLSGWWQLLYLTGIGIALLLVMWLLSSKVENNPYIHSSTPSEKRHAYL